MSEPGPPHDVTREVPRESATTRWRGRFTALATLSVLGLAVSEAFLSPGPALRGLFLGGLAVAGTGLFVLQARRQCPACGKRYGYHLRIVNAHLCPHCREPLPDWPGKEGGSSGATPRPDGERE